MAPFALLLTLAPLPPVSRVRRAALALGLGAGATDVCAGDAEALVLQAARALLYHLVQSVVTAVVLVVRVSAPDVRPVGVSLAAVRQTVLFALAFFVQS